MSRIPDDVIDAIRQAVDISELIGRYVPLKKAGRGLKACCPFHQEKTPSFHVWPATGTWKCFGCDKGGNHFSFLMEREGLLFPEAVRQLAKDVGIEVEPESPEAAAQASHMQRLRDVAEWACTKFETALRAPEGEPGREYFKRRGITGETAKTFRLGYAPPGWDRLLSSAERDGISEDELIECGLVILRDEPGERRKCYDRFRNRVIFPIADAQGRVVAFGARTLGDDEPKYLNSNETPLFKKGRQLYALHLSKQEMLRGGEGAVMEGYTDVIMAHQAGWPAAVAGLGTALTPDQARALSRYLKRLYLLYDGDKAGRAAAQKAIPSFLPEDIETRVVVLPAGKDPADLVSEQGMGALRAHLDASEDAFDHLVAAQSSHHDTSTVPGQAAAAEAVLDALVDVTNDIRRALYVKRVADAFGVPEQTLDARLQELVRRAGQRRSRSASLPPAPKRKRPAPRRAPPRENTWGDGPPADAYERLADDADAELEPALGGPVDAAPAASAPVASPDSGAEPEAARAPAGPVPRTERLLIEAMLVDGSLLLELPVEPDGGCGLFTHPLAQALLALFHEGLADNDGRAPSPELVLARIEDPQLAAFAAELRAEADAKPDIVRQGHDCIRRLEDQRQSRGLQDRVRRAAGSEDEDAALRELIEFHSRRAAGGGST